MGQDAQIVERVDLAGYGKRERPYPRPRPSLGVGGQQGRLRPDLFQILHDGEGLGENGAVLKDQGRHQTLGIECQIVRRPLLALAQMDEAAPGDRPFKLKAMRQRKAADERK